MAFATGIFVIGEVGEGSEDSRCGNNWVAICEMWASLSRPCQRAIIKDCRFHR
jgi:hypothetical protein